MEKEYDFSQALRAKDVPHLVMLREQILHRLRGKAPVTVEGLRRVLREELRSR